ncbi:MULTISPECIES: baseplate J/gp47 family protein [unclassified Serratia (in: enterobacteria)]|uniref:baseplate J/gp47 family protein n=1 Tax=unclassified Serratia (in: enterobacteria) TaxID=2647522 RepID=UPI002117BE94|nr:MULTISPECIES: baseplate J/gp47 family protein [unclassified Serratia (in: enterobacteria)]
MPFKRPTLTELREKSRTQLQSELRKTGALLRYSNMRVLADADAGLAHLHYGYLDYIALQATPFNSTDEWLAGWAGLKSVYQNAANPASTPSYQFSGTAGAPVGKGVVLRRGDGYRYSLVDAVKIGADGTAHGKLIAILPDIIDAPNGGGIDGNADAGTSLTLDISLPGVDASGVMIEPATGGADIETQESLRARMLLAYQSPPQGGSDTDYKQWALAVPGVTRCWPKRRLMGAGSVGVYIMCDGNDETNHGFPVGTDGISQLDDWGAQKATGDQGRVADYIYPLAPVTALVYVCSPVAKTINFEISGISHVGSDITAAIDAAIDNVFFEGGTPEGNGKIFLSDLNRAIGDIDGTAGFILVSPAANIELGVGELPVRGEVNYT